MKKVSYILSLFFVTLMFNHPIFGCASGEWEGVYTDYYFDPDLKSTPPFADFILESYFPDLPQFEEGDGEWIMAPGSGQTAYDDFVDAVQLDSRLTEQQKENLIALRGQCRSNNSYALIEDTLCGWFSKAPSGACEDFRQGNYEKVLESYDVEIKKTELSYSKEELLEQKSRIEAFVADKNNLLFDEINQSHGYGVYVNVVQLFKNGHYQKALENIRLVKSIEAPRWYDKLKFWEHRSDWLYQTACYMEARLLLIISQEKWSGYEPDETIDQEILLEAKNLFDEYLKKFPQGLYAETSHNIHRFIYRLARDEKSLSQALLSDLKTAEEILQADPKDEINLFKFVEILREVGRFSKAVVDYHFADPIGIAHNVLSVSPGKLEAIEVQKDKFKNYLGLYDLVWTWSAYQNQQYEKIAKRKFEEDSPTKLITQFIQARSLRVLKRYDEALALLRNQKKKDQVTDQAQAEIMCIYKEKGQGYAELFLEPVSDEVMQDILLYAIGDAQLLDWLTNKRDKYPDHVLSLMASELMTRYLAQGKMQDAMKLLNALPQSVISQYNDIRPAIEVLVKDPNDMKANLQMGRYVHEFVRGAELLDVEAYYYGKPDLAPIMCQRCNACKGCETAQSHVCQFREKRHASTIYPPYFYYKKVVDHFEKTKKKDDLEAEALHFLSICGKGYSPALECNWGHEEDFRKEVDVKKMFQILHKKYKGSTWANETPYYY